MEPNPDRLTLAPELECIMANCRCASGFRGDENMVLINIDSGSVDVLAYAIIDEHLEEIIPPQSNAWGGDTINETFRSFLGHIIRDPKFDRYIGPHIQEERRASNRRDLDFIVHREFEEIKCDFGSHYNHHYGPHEFTFQLPRSFCDTYRTYRGEEVFHLISRMVNSH